MRSAHLFFQAMALSLAVCACERPSAQAQASSSLFADAPDLQWRLPQQLTECAGLAGSLDGRVFAYDGDQAVIYQFDVAGGSRLRAFAVGEAVGTVDFDGLAISAAGDFWLVTSNGRLFRFREGADGERVRFE